MDKHKTGFLLLSALLLTGCVGQGKKEAGSRAEISAVPPSVSEETPRGDTPGHILLTIVGGKGSATVNKPAAEHVIFAFESGGYQRLHAELTTADPSANVRFTQIFAPDGSADGPFGRELDRELTRDGLYRLSVGENMMAGDPWAGSLTVTITLSN